MKNQKTFLNLLFVAVLFLCGCKNTNERTVVQTEAYADIFAMDTYMYIRAYGENADTVLKIVEERILSLEKIFSVTELNSDVWTVNHADGETVEVSDETISVLRSALDIANKTGGALDITLYPVLTAWGFTTEKTHIPDEFELAEALALVDFGKVKIENNSVTIPEKMNIDLGAVAKGYTSDEVVNILHEYQIESALVNLGGNVHVLGTKPDGSLWKVGIRDPFDSSKTVCIVELSDAAVITSGNYERCFTAEDGKKYWHIIDPSDGFPANNGIVSVTVIGTDGLLCDALSTALFVLGTERAIEYWQNNGEFEMIIVTDDAKVYYTEGLEECINFEADTEREVLHRE